MAAADDPQHNPYRAPEHGSSADAETRLVTLDELDDLRRFRWRANFFGVLAVLLSLVTAFTTVTLMQGGGAALNVPPSRVASLSIALGVVAAMWLLIGVGSLCKQLWALRIGLVLSYLTLLGNLSQLNFCSLVLCGGLVGMAHMATSAARVCRERDLPLTANPTQLEFAQSSEFER